MGRRIRQGKRSVKVECPSCGCARALEHRWDGRGNVVELKCRSCGTVFAPGLTRAEIQRPFPPGTRRRRSRRA